MRTKFKESDYIGKKFNLLTILSFTGIKNVTNEGQFVRTCLAKCDCGNIKEYCLNNIKSGMSKSCGCKPYQGFKNNVTSHPLYSTYASMIYRCYNKKDRAYKHYGLRGIKVCDRWLNDFNLFVSDMRERPSKDYSIDRVDNNGNYEPSNCKWSTRKEQMNNRQISHKLTPTNLSKATGYTKERIRQLVKTGLLKKYIIFEKNAGKNNTFVFDNSVIDFLIKRKIKNSNYFKRYESKKENSNNEAV